MSAHAKKWGGGGGINNPTSKKTFQIMICNHCLIN